ncbi:hypothetical protein [Streptomyces monashensis]|uniref:hypothetical protein n=1 Tax=Streptomyces monashensis TaxID=1678012 RepID=UPI0011603AF9|nr:hypothetical protein [Streptomyces monashensis]
MPGCLSGWQIPAFDPLATIPSGTRLTTFHSDDYKGSVGAPVSQRVVHRVEAGIYRPDIDSAFVLDDIVTAPSLYGEQPGCRESRHASLKRVAQGCDPAR